MIVKSSYDGMGECYTLDINVVVDGEDEYEVTYTKIPKKIVDPKTLKPRDCSNCTHFNFDWTRYWCSAGESQCKSSWNGAYGSCIHFIKGRPHNHEY